MSGHLTIYDRIRELQEELRSLTEERDAPVNAVCEQTWRRDVQGACSVHGGDSCLVSPSGQAEELERLREALKWIREGTTDKMAEDIANEALQPPTQQGESKP